ncbi:LysR family transcriptional regulator [Moraxella catarrhalis]|uniref:LysR family transcriptional regulator n=1 Tax=Moraxella catarrhalis TaxID=480 RepID=UPI0029E7CC7D|nr:LysR family transcriptional regulator [Moraxella catarrhalis]MPX39941.1 LysR family transcriptional regulator [Moraxella catarrhalis]MPX59006.1 LysR family transcriptional regulator [Moraxella catarrhalis]MPX80407.1 LysR family transcriptional regulator [Moraxella catarrhalis]
MSVTLRQLKAFLLVAEQNSFTKAAETLCLTQSALSGLIKELEQNLGVKLFDRTTRKLHLSDAGMRLLPQARRVLNEMSVLNEKVNNLKSLHQGHVRLAVSQQLSASTMPKFVAKFCDIHPNIQVTLTDCSVDDVVEHIENLEADLGVAPERVHSDDLQAVVLFSSPFYLVLPATHPFAKKDVLRWTDLLNERLITLNGPFIKSLQNELPAQISSRIFNSEFEVNFLSTALGMTRMGLGVTLCLLYAAEWVEQNGLVMRPIADPVVERKFLLYTHKNRSLSPAALAFKEFLEHNAHEFLVSHSKVSGI